MQVYLCRKVLPLQYWNYRLLKGLLARLFLSESLETWVWRHSLTGKGTLRYLHCANNVDTHVSFSLTIHHVSLQHHKPHPGVNLMLSPVSHSSGSPNSSVVLWILTKRIFFVSFERRKYQFSDVRYPIIERPADFPQKQDLHFLFITIFFLFPPVIIWTWPPISILNCQVMSIHQTTQFPE